MEAQPEGFVSMQMEVVDARSVDVKWNPPSEPNGDIYYDVYFEGLFYSDPGKMLYTAGQRWSANEK